jgi:hypothetical protein
MHLSERARVDQPMAVDLRLRLARRHEGDRLVLLVQLSAIPAAVTRAR